MVQTCLWFRLIVLLVLTDKRHAEHVRWTKEEKCGVDYRINFDEPLPDMIERLKKEHRQIGVRLDELESIGVTNKEALEILQELGDPIVHHAVEEEAVVMRVIMHKAKEQAGESIKIAQEHNWIVDFIRKTIPKLASMPQHQAEQEVTKFIQNLRSHFSEEEQIMFPLAIKASLNQEK